MGRTGITKGTASSEPRKGVRDGRTNARSSLIGLADLEGLKDPPAGWVPVSSRGRAQQELITTTAFSLFKDQSYHVITAHDISQAAGLSIGTLYRYFPSKEAIFISVLDRALMEMYDASRPVGVDKGAESNFARSIHKYLMAFYENRRIIASARGLMTTSPGVFQMWCGMRQHIHQRMYHRLVRHQASSGVVPLEPRGLMTALASMVDGYAQRAFIDEEFGSLSESEIKDAASALAGVWKRAVFGI